MKNPIEFITQLWRCRKCRAIRTWGTDAPGEYIPVLKCACSPAPQRHDFAGNGTATWIEFVQGTTA